jgi:trehalose-6-phosphate synthase
MARPAGLILANRAYLDHAEPPGSGASVAPAVGGLLAAVRPVIEPWQEGAGTTWIGAGRGACDRAWCDERGFEFIDTPRGQLRHRRLFFDERDWQAHYGRVANGFLWPLLHLVTRPLPLLAGYYPAPAIPSGADWEAYRAVNAAFARAAADERDATTCWVHDYHLSLVPRMLREAGFGGRIGFFLHTPFPDIAVASPFLGGAGRERFAECVRGMLGADLLGFQTAADLERFAACATALCSASSDGRVLRVEGRTVCVATDPAGIDTDEILAVASSSMLPPEMAALVVPGRPLVVGLERADFTKGIPERLRCVARAFERGLSFTYIGVAAPTREGVETYRGLGPAIEEAARAAAAAAPPADGAFLQLQETVPFAATVALQAAADVVFTSSLADGMNLVPLQAAIAQSLRPPSRRAVLLAGRDSGVAVAYAGFEPDGLVPIDPLDPTGMDSAFADALAGRPGRVSDRLVAEVRRRDARAWVRSFLAELEAVPC